MSKATTSMPETKRWSSNWSRGVPGLLWRLARVGIRIHLFLVVREGAPSNIEHLTTDPRFSFGFVGTDDIPELVRVRPGVDAAKCAERLRGGLLCYVVKDGSRIVSMMWCDLEKFDVETFHRRLGDREAYLFGAYTDPAYRGQNLAPFLRLKCYSALRAIGRDSFFSITEYFNTAAHRYKEKLGAVDESLHLNVGIFGWFSRTLTLRRYTADV
jgi:ribosomal protein S18 acetylase RimI-like enzyme